jgi:DNA-binding NtrC family response regulator
MDKIRYVDEYLNRTTSTSHSISSVYDYFNTSSSTSSYEKMDKNGITKENLEFFEDFLRKYLEVPKEFRDIVECKIQNPSYGHREIAKELGISRKHLYMKYLKMARRYKPLIYFTHRLFKGNPKRAHNSKPDKPEEEYIEFDE